MTPPTFRQFIAEKWKTPCYDRCKPSTRQRMDSALRTQLLPTFGARRLDRISREAVHAWFDGHSGTAPAGANRSLDVLRQIFNHAIACGYVTTNPTRDVRRNPRPKRTRFLSRTEIGRLHKELEVHHGRGSGKQQAEIIRLLLLTGCRKGEIVRLRWSEVQGDTLHLTDSKIGRRTVVLNAPARAVLARQPRTESPYVFPALTDSSRSRSGELSLWRKVRQRAGIGNVRLHDLRHTFASHAVMQSVPLPVVSRLLGHSQARMTLRYAHVSDRETESAAERVGCAIAALLTTQDPIPAERDASLRNGSVSEPAAEGTDSWSGSASQPQNGEGTDRCEGSGRDRPAAGNIVLLSDSKTDVRSMHVTRLRAKNQLTLPASVVSAVGLKQGDVLHIATDQDRVIITAQELRDRGRKYTMSDLLGAASGLYDSVEEIDAEVTAGRAE